MNQGKLTYSASFQEAKFEKDKHIIRGVVLLGPVSKNKREYTRECMQKSIPLFEGVQAFINHPSSEEEKTGRRDVRNLAGKYVNARYEEGKVKADAMLLPNENGKLYMDVAETMPDVAGNSQNAHGKWRSDGGKQIVEELTQVFSVDLVANPATTRGMFESDDNQNSNFKENETMEWTQINAAQILANRPDIHEAIKTEGAKSRDAEVVKLNEQIATLKKANDEYQVKEALAVKSQAVNKAIEESKLPKEAITDTFRESLMAAKDDVAVKAIIEDRKKLIESASGGVRNMGGEGNTNEGKNLTNDQAAGILLG